MTSGQVLLGSEPVRCIADAHPLAPGHSLVITQQQMADELVRHQPEWNALVELLKLRREPLSVLDASFSGWTVGLISSETAGQTVVLQAHWHLIAGQEGSYKGQKGGVRGLIEGRQGD